MRSLVLKRNAVAWVSPPSAEEWFISTNTHHVQVKRTTARWYPNGNPLKKQGLARIPGSGICILCDIFFPFLQECCTAKKVGLQLTTPNHQLWDYFPEPDLWAGIVSEYPVTRPRMRSRHPTSRTGTTRSFTLHLVVAICGVCSPIFPE